MKALWDLQEGTVSDVMSALSSEERDLAPTTVATLLQRLSKQGWVRYRKHGRQFVYRAAVKREVAAQGVLQRIVGTFFGGKVSALTAQLLQSEDLTAQELEQLKQLLDRKGG